MIARQLLEDLSRECLCPGSALRRRLRLEHPDLAPSVQVNGCLDVDLYIVLPAVVLCASTARIATALNDYAIIPVVLRPFSIATTVTRITKRPSFLYSTLKADAVDSERDPAMTIGDLTPGHGMVHVMYDAASPLANTYKQFFDMPAVCT